MVKKLLITGAFGTAAEEMAKYSVPGFRKYADKFGYDFAFIRKYNDQHPSWQKVYALREYLETYDLVLWIDIDAVIVKFDKDIASVFDFANGFQALACEPDEPNCGVWLMKKGIKAFEFLHDLIEISPRFVNPCWEQDAVHHLLGFRNNMLQPDRCLQTVNRIGTILMPEKWNDVHRGRIKDGIGHIKHFAGRTDEEKVRMMRKLCGLLDYL